MHASRRAAIKQGSTVLVFGAGAVGLLCAAMARVHGAKTVIIADIQERRIEFAISHKFADGGVVVPMKRQTATQEKLVFAKEVSEMVKRENGGGEVDRVFECSGVESCLQTAIYVGLLSFGPNIYANPISLQSLAGRS